MTTTPARDAAAVADRSGAFTGLHHRLAANEVFYDLIQRLAGASAVSRNVAPLLRFAPGMRVLDVGGGTGTVKSSLAPGVRHVCVDLERAKLNGYKSKFEDARPVQGDAAALPVRNGAVDAVTLALVTHHLTEPDLRGVLGEIARVLAPSGVLVLYDAVWAPLRPASRVLWRLDRGSHPRTAQQLEAALRQHFTVVGQRQFAVFHRYVAFVCRPRGELAAS